MYMYLSTLKCPSHSFNIITKNLNWTFRAHRTKHGNIHIPVCWLVVTRQSYEWSPLEYWTDHSEWLTLIRWKKWTRNYFLYLFLSLFYYDWKKKKKLKLGKNKHENTIIYKHWYNKNELNKTQSILVSMYIHTNYGSCNNVTRPGIICMASSSL